MEAVIRAITHGTVQLWDHVATVHSDNAAAATYTSREGGTSSTTLTDGVGTLLTSSDGLH